MPSITSDANDATYTQILCDMTTDSGGWMVRRRINHPTNTEVDCQPQLSAIHHSSYNYILNVETDNCQANGWIGKFFKKLGRLQARFRVTGRRILGR